MLINLRNALMAGKKSPLPPGARWVEYLQSTGTQWIDTGILASSNLNDAQIDITYMSPVTSVGDLYIFGGGNTYGTAIQAVVSTHTGYLNVSWGQSIQEGDAYQSNVVANLRMNYNDWMVTFGTTVRSGAFTATSRTFSERNIYLFRLNRASGGINTNKDLRIYGFKLSRDGALVRDFRSIAIGTTGYMLDLVSGEHLPYGNKGTGDFVIGPDIPSPV